MNVLREASSSFVLTLAIGGIITALIPDRMNKRAFSILFSLAVLCALILPLSSGKVSFPSYSLEEQSEKTQEYEQELILRLTNQAEKAAYNAVENLLISLGVKDYEIYPIVSADGTIINLEEVSIYLSNAYSGRESEVRLEVEKALGVVAEVKIKDE